MKLNNRPILGKNSSINSKLIHSVVPVRHPIPVNEGKYVINYNFQSELSITFSEYNFVKSL